MLTKEDLEAIGGLITSSESLLLDEMDRYDQKNEKRFDTISKDIENLKSIYALSKLERRVSELEKKSA